MGCARVDPVVTEAPVEERSDRTTRVLVIDDEPAMARVVAHALGKSCTVRHVGEPDQIRGLAQSSLPDEHDVIVLDVGLDRLSGLDVLAQLKAAGCQTAIVMLTGDCSSSTATAALRGGAFHYLNKPIDLPALVEVVELAARQTRLTRQLARTDGGDLDVTRGIVGSSLSMTRLRARIAQLGRADVSVLIAGESGTGKELVARALHEASSRRAHQFVALNCGAIASDLIDSELFGHAKGAFTGAIAARPGVFVEADGGTLFLDEIGDMPTPVQSRLLRVLQEGEVRAVGADGVQRVDVRVIAATHVDLAHDVQCGKFRSDLYFRLNVVQLEVPPLREHLDDLPELIAALLRRHAGTAPPVASEALEAMMSYPWPGNVRELENALRHALAMRSHDELDLASLPPAVAASLRTPRLASGTTGPIEPLSEAKRRAANEFERDYLVRLLDQARGSITAAARAAGIDRTNFRRLLQRHGIEKDSSSQG